MAKYLLDVTVLSELIDPDSAWHASISDSVDALHAQGHGCFIEERMLADLYSSLTRPAMLNGHDLSPERAAEMLDVMRGRYEVLPAPSPAGWLATAKTYELIGESVRLAQTLAAMEAAGIAHLVTLAPPFLPEACTVEIVSLDPALV